MDKKAIREELNKVRAEIRKLKDDFSKKKVEKEEHFARGEDCSEKINVFYEEIKKIELEGNLDEINKELEKKQSEHDILIKEVKELEQNFKDTLSNMKKKTFNKPVVKTLSSEKAKKEIKKLDLKLQTQVLSLEKESELIKKIQELKEQVSSVSNLDSYDSGIRDSKKELNSKRRKYNAVEKKIRHLYKQIRLISKEKKKKYKEIDSLRNSKKKAFEDFRNTKKDYSNTGKELRELFKKETDFLEQLGESPVQRKKAFDKDIKKKRKEVEDNFMKKGGTLTTEDFLMFQK